MPPPDAVIVSGAAPNVALDAAVSFSVLLCVPAPESADGEKLAVTPAGSPLIESATEELNPPIPVMVTVSERLDPCASLPVVTLSFSEKLGGGLTVTVIGRFTVMPPPDAAMVTVEFPSGAAEAALIVRMLVPEPLSGRVAVEKLAVTPLPRPLTVRPTEALNPYLAARLRFTFELAPCTTATDFVFALSVKLGGGVTTRVTGQFIDKPPPVARIVMAYVATVACAVALSVSRLLPDPGAGKLDGEKLAATPVFRPVTLSATAELNPLAAVAFTFSVVLAP